MEEASSIREQLESAVALNPDDREAILALSAEVRRTLEATAIPDELGPR